MKSNLLLFFIISLLLVIISGSLFGWFLADYTRGKCSGSVPIVIGVCWVFFIITHFIIRAKAEEGLK